MQERLLYPNSLWSTTLFPSTVGGATQSSKFIDRYFQPNASSFLLSSLPCPKSVVPCISNVQC